MRSCCPGCKPWADALAHALRLSSLNPAQQALLCRVRRCLDMLQECRSVMLFKRHKKISEGSYGIVYRGEEVSTGHVVALKKVRSAGGPRWPVLFEVIGEPIKRLA